MRGSDRETERASKRARELQNLLGAGVMSLRCIKGQVE